MTPRRPRSLEALEHLAERLERRAARLEALSARLEQLTAAEGLDWLEAELGRLAARLERHTVRLAVWRHKCRCGCRWRPFTGPRAEHDNSCEWCGHLTT